MSFWEVIFCRQSSHPVSPARGPLLCHGGLVLEDARRKLAVLELLLQKMADCGIFFHISFSSHHISPEFSSIGFCLKSLPPQESAWPRSCSPGAMPSGLAPWSVLCAERRAAPYQALGADQFAVGCLADNISNPFSACTML